ncbi:unnamed protein product [Aureobasidium mustum]|uniref:Uncharacterized protein n=1 Tax=Aureobasidium mustum TaxID=2773714 RepID=A0A9N8K7U9_9PEZI|nr:unnamed protein product [Aureobasidium mustum]
MCCKRRANTQASTVAKLAQDQPITTSRAAHDEPLGPPPAYEHIEKESKDVASSKGVDASNFLDHQRSSEVRALPVYGSNNANLDLTPDYTTTYTPRSTCQSRCAAKRERKQQKREHRHENRMEKREYRQEKRELRAEHRFERKEMRRAHGGPISMLIKGVSNLMKQ